MKPRRRWLRSSFILAALLVCGGACELHAFHDGGVGACEGCHAIHGSADGALPVGSRALLQGTDAGSTCLNCHEQNGDPGPTSFHVSTPLAELPAGIPPKQLSPGGDFGWLKKSYSWYPAFATPAETSPGDRHGHNIVAADYGYTEDLNHLVAPGGYYPATALSCVSCHNPHGIYRRNLDGSIATGGKPIAGTGSYATSIPPGVASAVGVYRLLGGAGHAVRSVGSALAFVSDPPAAVAPENCNRSESAAPVRVAYGNGISDWCKNCHPLIHTDSAPTPLIHPAGGLTGGLSPAIVSQYNQYVKTGDLAGVEAQAYSSLVPFEAGTSNYEILRSVVTSEPLRGPNTVSGTPAVMCLTCHRAHASGWDSATRWNSKTAYVVADGNYDQAGMTYQPYGQGRSAAEALRSYQELPATLFAPNQTTLCYKCHETLP